MSEQFDLFDTECPFCNPTVCKCDPSVCRPDARQCCTGACMMNQANPEIESILVGAETEEANHDTDIKLALAHRSVRELTINVLEVLDTHARIEQLDENIFLSAPKIDAETAQILYQKLLSIHELLEAVRKNRKNGQ